MPPNRKIARLDAAMRTGFVEASAVDWSFICQTNYIYFSEPNCGGGFDYVDLAKIPTIARMRRDLL